MERYDRQMRLPGFGPAGQERLAAARVAIVGCGATGSVLASWLARAGVGALRLIDRDWVEKSNLQRQGLYDEGDLEVPKAIAAVDTLRRVNGSIELVARVADLAPDSIADLLDGVDLVLDGTDNSATRLLLNDWCASQRLPWVYAGAHGFVGQSALFLPGAACFRCYVPALPPPGAVPTCDTVGVLGPAVGVLGSLAASTALRFLAGDLAPAQTSILRVDLREPTLRTTALPPDPACPTCAGRYDFLDGDAFPRTHVLCGSNAVQLPPRGPVDLARLEERWTEQRLGSVSGRRFFVRLTVDTLTLTVFPDGRCVVSGCDDPGRARAFVDRYLGG